MRLWDRQNLQPLAVLTNQFEVYSIAFCHDGETLAAAGWDDLTLAFAGAGLNFWDLASQQPVAGLDGETRGTIAVAFSPAGRHLATGDRDGNVVLWDWPARRRLGSFRPFPQWVRRLTFSSNGVLLACAGAYDASIALYDVHAVKLIALLKGHAGNLWGLAFCPDSQTLASTSYDGRTILWNMASRQPVLTLKGNIAFGVAFSQDGTLLATCGSDAKVRLWPAAPFELTDTPGARTLSQHP